MTLEVEIYGRNLEMTDRIQDYVNKKVGKLAALEGAADYDHSISDGHP